MAIMTMKYIFIIVHLYLTPPQTWTLLLQHKQTGRQMSLLPASALRLHRRRCLEKSGVYFQLLVIYNVQ